MSHGVVAVVTDSKPTEEELAEILMPYHEFECTGINDQYVKEIDETRKLLDAYETTTRTMVRCPDGELVAASDERFYRDPTPEEQQKIGLGGMGFIGGPDGFSFYSRDWNDGRGYRAKIQYVPDGHEQVKVALLHLMTFREYVANDYSADQELQFGETPDLEKKHKFGWTKLDADGKVTEVIRRTNPNAKWDWWQIGGRYSGRLAPDYDPETDPENWETCWLCDGTGRRLPAAATLAEIAAKIESLTGKNVAHLTKWTIEIMDMVDEHTNEIKAEFNLDDNGRVHCNGCDGKGTSLKWPSKWLDRGNQIRWGDIDRGGLEAKKSKELGEAWDKAEAQYNTRVANFTPERMSFGEALREYEALVKELRESYTEGDREPLYQKIQTHPRGAYLRQLVGDAEMFYGIEGTYSRDEHVALAQTRALTFFAIVKDGQWVERGQLGGWGVVHDENEDWPTTMNRILDTIRPDQWVTVVDFHI